MLKIGNYIISSDLIEKKFACDLRLCSGNCCRYGDAGAPVSADEVVILEKIKNKIFPYMREEGRRAVTAQGTSVIDIEGESVTPLIDNKECAYTIYENVIFKCAIEKAWEEGKVDFRKPLSCHLFPVRIKQIGELIAVNVDEWHLCQAGKEKGRREGIYLYEFLAEALKREMGEDNYRQICIAAEKIKK